MNSLSFLNYRKLVRDPRYIVTMSDNNKLAALEYATEVKNREEQFIQRMIETNPSYKYPKEYLPDRLFEYWDMTKQMSYTEAVDVIALIEANLPAYNKPGERVTPEVKKEEVAPVMEEVAPEGKKKEVNYNWGLPESSAFFHYVISNIKDLPGVEYIPFYRKKEIAEAGQRLYGVDGNGFYRAYSKLNGKANTINSVIEKWSATKFNRVKKLTFEMADRTGRIEYKGWWNHVAEENRKNPGVNRT